MAKKIHQFVIEEKDLSNFQEQNIINIIEKYVPVIKLGVQSVEGTTFQINGGSDIKIGRYGIYELDLSAVGGVITSLTFTRFGESGTSAIVDIIYDALGGVL